MATVRDDYLAESPTVRDAGIYAGIVFTLQDRRGHHATGGIKSISVTQ